MEIPNWLRGSVTKEGLDTVKMAVADAESRTSAEIVPMVVRGSITTGHVPWLLFFMMVPVTWMLIPLVLHNIVGEILTVVVAAAFAFGLKNFAFIQRWLTPEKDEEISVMRRAQLEFHLAHLKATEGRTGVLVFVSMLEHKAVVLADQAIAEKFDPSTWDQVLEVLLSHTKKKDLVKGMAEAVKLLGTLLAKEFPAPVHNVNELPNGLIVKD